MPFGPLATAGGGGGAPDDAQYVVMVANATLTQERILTGTASRIVVTDGGAGLPVTLSPGALIVQTDQANLWTAGSQIIQSAVDTLTAFQVFDADGGAPVLSVDTINERVGIGVAAPGAQLQVDTSGPTVIGQIIKLDPAQSENAFEVQNSAGVVRTSIEFDGAFNVGSSGLPITYTSGVGNKSANEYWVRYAPTAAFSLSVSAIRTNMNIRCFTAGANINVAETTNLGQFSIQNLNAAATVSGFCSGFRAEVIADSASCDGQVNHLVGFHALKMGLNNNPDCLLLNTYGFYAASPLTTSTGAGTVQNTYGLYLENHAGGTALNYGIYTNAGDVRFGDSVLIDNLATTKVGLTIQGAAAQTANLTNWETSAGVALMEVEAGGVVDYRWAMGNSTKDPRAVLPDDWVEIKIGGATYYLPAYLV